MVVYRIVNTKNDKIYIGKHQSAGLKRYFQRKLYEAFKYPEKRSLLYAAIRKYGREAFLIEPIAEVNGSMSKETLADLEMFCISFFDARDTKKGYNICRGGEGFTGPHTEQAREKIRAAGYGRKHTLESRRKMLGRKHTPEAIVKMQANPRTARQLANLNRSGSTNISEETRNKMRISHLGKTNRLGIPCSPECKDKLRSCWTPEKRQQLSEKIRKTLRERKLNG